MLYLALLHYPVINKDGEVVSTSVANMDIHDISRVAKTFGVKAFYIVNPIEAQRKLASEIMQHWQSGYGAKFNKLRKEAFDLVRLKENLDDVLLEIKTDAGSAPQTVATGANLTGKLLKFSELKEKVRNHKLPYLLIFGTGSGLAAQVIAQANFSLEPIIGVGNYNHLAVRSAVAIILDRINRT